MSRIAFFVDLERGHMLASCDLAHRAQAHDHSVTYFAPADSAGFIRSQGFPVLEVLQSALPANSVEALRREASFDSDRYLQLASARVLPTLASGVGLKPAIEAFRPELLICNSLFQLEALAVYLRHELPMALITPNIRLHSRQDACRIDLSRLFEMTDGTEEMISLIRARLPGARSLDELVRVMMRIPDLLLMPRGLELPDHQVEPNTWYVGSAVNLDRPEPPFDPGDQDGSMPVVYCSLGSQSDLRREVRERFFREVLAAAANLPSLRFVIAIGPQTDPAIFAPPPNAMIVQWAPQMTLLQRAALMITHAGTGTVKECAISGVPMLAFPIGRDQFACARRIAHHRLGVVGNIETVTALDLTQTIARTISDPAVRAAVDRVRDNIIREDARAASFDIFTAILHGFNAPGPRSPMTAASIS